MNIMRKLLPCFSLLLVLAACAYQGQNVFPLDKVYPAFENISKDLNAFSAAQPAFVKHRIIGFTDTEELPLYALELGRGQKNILIIGQHHGEEVLGIALVYYFAESLSRSYEKSARVQKILDDYTLWLLPSINPEAWRLVSAGIINSKRKNNRDTNKNGRLDLRTDGVDLNRNYPVFWDRDTETNPLSSYYKGSAPASESETQSIISLARKQDFDFAIFYHSSALGLLNERIFLPAISEPDSTFLHLQHLAALYASKVKKDYQKGHYELHTGQSSRVGNARNFFYHSLGVPAMLIEIGGVNKAGQSVIHPPKKMVKRIQKRHLEALLVVLEEME